MRVLLHQDAVVVRARLGLIGVDAEVDRPGVVLGQEGPLEPARGSRRRRGRAGPESLTCATTSSGFFSLQHALEGRVAAVGAVALQPVAVRLVDAGQQDGFVRSCAVSTSLATSRINSSAFSGVTFITCSSFTQHAGAPSHAPMHSANSSVILPSAVVSPHWHAELLLAVFDQLVAAAQHARQRRGRPTAASCRACRPRRGRTRRRSSCRGLRPGAGRAGRRSRRSPRSARVRSSSCTRCSAGSVTACLLG